MTNLFPVIQIDTDAEIPETLGTKEKFWINHQGALCLVKFGREGTGEDWAEKVACELCELLDLPHAHYDFANFQNRRGVLTPSIVEEDGRLILGNELINRVRPDYDGAKAYQQTGHTVMRVLAALELHTRPNHQATLRRFIGYLLLDAWIGNTDRHHENWGLIVARDRTISLAPTFDHASSLGRELSDQTRMKRLTTRDPRFSVAAFAKKARSALYADPGDRKPLAPIDAFAMAARVQPESGNYWLDRLEQTRNDDIGQIFESIPPDIISEAAKEFAMRLLTENRSKLLLLRT